MRFLLQVVDAASVIAQEKNYEASIHQWLLIYVWVHKNDVVEYQEKIRHFVAKIRQLQIFHVDGKLQWTLDSVWGEIMLISNFTLYWENRKGNRFDFGDSAWFEDAKMIYDALVVALQIEWIAVKTGVFGAYMRVESTNAGPINVVWNV